MVAGKLLMKQPLLFRLTALVSLISSTVTALGQETDLVTRDPSTIIKRGETYWVFGTGRGCPSYSSTDRAHWSPRGPVLTAAPSWVQQAVPANRNNNIWAPDVRLVH